MRKILMATAAGALITSAIALGAPGGGTGAASAQRGAPAARPEQSRSMTASETKAREQDRQHAPDKGERERAQSEISERDRAQNQGKGEATSAEMQARREERKEIQEETRARSADAGSAKPAKKPWWKFWGDDAS
jgi:hypothetical protein